jgi:hypothetical protein
MFDAVIFSGRDPEAAARTMACLVEGVVEGMLLRVLVVSAERDTDLGKLSDASGCRLEQGVAADKLAGVLAAHLQTPHVLAFEAGALFPPGWPQLLQREFQRRGQPDAEVALAFRPDSLGDRLRLIARIGIRGRVPLTYGALLPRERLTDKAYRGGAVKSHGPIHLTQMSVARMV